MQDLPIQFDPHAIAEYRALFAACFPGEEKFTQAYLEWLYIANPDGNAVGFDMWDGDQLAAHYVCLPAQARVNGVDVRVLQSCNTATHPAYQGKGLFTKLAQMTYQTAAEQGFDGIYGVGNAVSTPGFIRKLGHQLIRPLETRVGIGRLPTGAQPVSGDLSFERRWNQASIDWRCANPNRRVMYRQRGARWQFHAAAFGAALPVYAELPVHGLQLNAPLQVQPISPVRLFIGLIPDQLSHYWNYVSIPKKLRPSPLNLHYRSLSPRVTKLDPGMVRFSFLDFDAY